MLPPRQHDFLPSWSRFVRSICMALPLPRNEWWRYPGALLLPMPCPPPLPSTPSFCRQKCAWSVSLQDAIQSESFTRNPRRNELFQSASAKPVIVNCRPPDYTARDGLHIADGAEPWCGPARRLANPCVARTSGAPSCALFRSPVPGPGQVTRYSANVPWRPRFAQRFPHR